MEYRGIANTRIVTRFKQVIILVAIIIAGIAISMATEAKSGSVTNVTTSVPNK